MKITKDQLKEIIKEEIQLSEFWGKKKPSPKRASSTADALEQAVKVMTQPTESFQEINGLSYIIWGPWDDPIDAELMRLGQAFVERLKIVAKEHRAKSNPQ